MKWVAIIAAFLFLTIPGVVSSQQDLPPEKQGLGESDPEGQFIELPAETPPAQPTTQTQPTVTPSAATTQPEAEQGQVAAEITETPETPATNLTEQEQAAIDQGNQNFTDYLSWFIIISGVAVLAYGMFHLHRLMKD